MDYRSIPVDADSAARIAATGLRIELVDTSDDAAFTSWLSADVRGFHSEASADQLTKMRGEFGHRRTTGVYDATAAEPSIPVGTVNSWPVEMSVPGGACPESWGISSVTVAPTHRGRGIARALLEGELRTASRLGLPFAALTVSESTLYGRYGFGPAAFAADYRFDTRRVSWSGPRPDGRVQFVSIDEYLEKAPQLYERTRRDHAGQIDVWPRRWAQVAGQTGDDAAAARRVRAVRYDDASGTPRGYAVYEVTGGDDDFTSHEATLRYLLADGVDAYAALWRFVLELPLVRTVVATLRSVDEPVRWMLRDWRAVSTTSWDHLWVRVLDVPAALGSRVPGAEGTVVVEVDDPMGFAAGAWRIDGGAERLRAEPASEADAALPRVSLGASELASLSLGGVSASVLAQAGRVSASEPSAVAVLDALLSVPRAPWLSVWF
ncbi:GNAT family N-acetyltransferase [Homoserinibacter sp. GY 40078]|uniref:GNAT family N-acetyltransferase n=1 Tax=Homoserinibacter sp. GY 40078 TaxID=2603275 RepID=UPI0011C88715|nr:GNAT family N-acetyltransferase [Homoserinibacter sp. GY 40078]TXK17338.1 GNAT family N-acetyltransferase [Homoserinibacter sp. GY 40078]